MIQITSLSQAEDALHHAVAYITEQKGVSFRIAYDTIAGILGLEVDRPTDWPLVMAFALKVLGVPGKQARLCVPSKTSKGCVGYQHYRRLVAPANYHGREYRLVFAYDAANNDDRARLFRHAVDCADAAWIQIEPEQRASLLDEARPILQEYGIVALDRL